MSELPGAAKSREMHGSSLWHSPGLRQRRKEGLGRGWGSWAGTLFIQEGGWDIPCFGIDTGEVC